MIDNCEHSTMYTPKMKITCLVFALIFFKMTLSAQAQNNFPVKDVLRLTEKVSMSGYLAHKLDESINNRILAQDVDRLIEPFKLENRKESRLWQSEFWGKWFTSAVLAYKYKADNRLKKTLEYAAENLLATQSPDGYIGNYAKDKRLQQWDIWGQKYCMLGLLAYYDLTKNKKVLIGAVRLADYLIAELNRQGGIIVTQGNYRGMAASSVLEPICMLYKYTNDKKYLDFAKEIVRQWETAQGPQLLSKSQIDVSERFSKPKSWYSFEQGQKAYEMMSCYEGLLELYRLTGDVTYKYAVENTWENIRKTEINIAGSGASTEMWFGGKAAQSFPINHYQETCVTVTWLKLTHQLLRLTGESKYADEAEKTYYNALLGAMGADAAVWAKYTPLNGQRLPGSEQCGMGLNCCEASGPRGLFNLPAYIVTERNEGLQINYFAEGIYNAKSPTNQKVTISQRTDYPQSGQTHISLEMIKPEAFEITIRIPKWSKRTTLAINGENIDSSQFGQLAKIKRIWKSGDQISLKLDMRGRVIESDSFPKSFAIMTGPIVLTRDARLEEEGVESVLKPVIGKDGYVELTRSASRPGGYFMTFEANFIPESYTEYPKAPISVSLCDYASAGNGQKRSFYKVWMPQLVNPKEDSFKKKLSILPNVTF